MARWFVDRCAQRGIPAVSLRRLFPLAEFRGCRDLVVSGCAAESLRLEPGQVFVDVRGGDPSAIRRALDRGAVGVILEESDPDAGPLQVIVDDARRAFARLCQALAGEPSETLRVVGVAGAHGQTAAAWLARSVFEAAGHPCGLIAPNAWSDGQAQHPCIRETPGPEGLSEMLAAMVERGATDAVVAVGSRALEERAVEGLSWDAVLVTHVVEPLDDEATRRRRTRIARLVRRLRAGGAAVLNADDPDAALLAAVALDARPVTFGLGAVATSEVSAVIDRLDPHGSRFRLRGFDREGVVRFGLIGVEAVRAAVGASALAWSRGIGIEAVVAGLEAVRAIPGRLEPVEAAAAAAGPADRPLVVVDGARTAPRLARALAALRQSAGRETRIHCVFGSEGGTAFADRLALARAAEAGADRLILTADNPKTEDADQILDDLLAGLKRPGRARVVPDRRAAIAAAVAQAMPGDIVLIAGKGRDSFQIFADRAVPFADAAVAAEALGRLGQTGRYPHRRQSA